MAMFVVKYSVVQNNGKDKDLLFVIIRLQKAVTPKAIN